MHFENFDEFHRKILLFDTNDKLTQIEKNIVEEIILKFLTEKYEYTLKTSDTCICACEYYYAVPILLNNKKRVLYFVISIQGTYNKKYTCDCGLCYNFTIYYSFDSGILNDFYASSDDINNIIAKSVESLTSL